MYDSAVQFRDAVENLHNISRPGAIRFMDAFPIRGITKSGGIPLFVLNNSGLGINFKLSPINGTGWDEGKRQDVLDRLHTLLRLEDQESPIAFTTSFYFVRRPFDQAIAENLERDYPLSAMRARDLMKL
ncbi:MAG: hypothetical protein EOP06_03780, partial [Proteobacteria bacterium]